MKSRPHLFLEKGYWVVRFRNVDFLYEDFSIACERAALMFYGQGS